MLLKIELKCTLVQKKIAYILLIKKKIKFSKGETIHTENSHKYTKDKFAKLVKNSGFEIIKHFTDKNKYFGVFLLKVK